MSTGNGSGDEDGDGRKGKTREVRHSLWFPPKCHFATLTDSSYRNPRGKQPRRKSIAFCMREFMTRSRLVKNVLDGPAA